MSLKNKLFSLGLATMLGLKVLMPIEAKADDLNRNNFNLENITKIKDSKRTVNLLELGLYGLGSYGLTTFIHEGGHYITGLGLGAEDLEMDLIPKKEENGILFASVKRNGLDKNEEIIFNLAGVGTTRIGYELLNHYINDGKMPDNFERFGSVLALFLRLDLPRDLGGSSIRHYSNGDGNYLDVYSILNDNFDKKERDYVYGGLLLLEGLDLYLDRKEIKNHIYRSLGKPVSELEDKKVDLNFDFGKDNIFVGLEYNF